MSNVSKRLLFSSIICLTLATPAFSQSSGSTDAGATTASAKEPQAQTITGRITKLDTKAGLFSVRAGANGKVVDLRADKNVDTKSLRRGERVVVTYADGVALTVQATRSEK
jgi:hypothetical protein